MTNELAVFRVFDPHAEEAAQALDKLHTDLQQWIEDVKAEAQKMWGRDPVLLAWRERREVYGIEDVPWAERPNRQTMPTKEWKRLNVPTGWERLVDHGSKPEALRPRLKATKDWVKDWTMQAPPTPHKAVAKALGIQVSCFYGLHLTSFGFEPMGEHGAYLSWPAGMIEAFQMEDLREHYLPTYAERVPLSQYYAAKEAFEAESSDDE